MTTFGIIILSLIQDKYNESNCSIFSKYVTFGLQMSKLNSE